MVLECYHFHTMGVENGSIQDVEAKSDNYVDSDFSDLIRNITGNKTI